MEKVYATYTYDAWGKLIGITNYTGASILGKTNGTSLANLNPLRYRGYYYDNETGFYYLQSRYYDPTLKRFLNADAYVSTGQGFIGTNMFAYCNNCPVLFADPYGYDSGEAVASLTGWELLLLWLNESSAASTVIWCFAPMLLFTKAEPVVITKTAMPDAPDTTAPPDNSVSSAEEAEAATGAPQPPNRNRKKKKNKKQNEKNYKKVNGNKAARELAQEQGFESAEDLKENFVIRRDVSKFNMVIDMNTFELILISLQNSNIVIHTGIFIK